GPRPFSCAWWEELSERSLRIGVCKPFARSHPPIFRARTSCISTLLRWPLHSLHHLLPHFSPATHQLVLWCAPTLARFSEGVPTLVHPMAGGGSLSWAKSRSRCSS